MKISRAEVEHIADLARLELSEAEIERLQSDLSQILDYVEQLNELDTSNVSPTAHVIAKGDVLREDSTRPSCPSEAMLSNAPQSQDGYFRVLAIFSREEE